MKTVLLTVIAIISIELAIGASVFRSFFPCPAVQPAVIKKVSCVHERIVTIDPKEITTHYPGDPMKVFINGDSCILECMIIKRHKKPMQ